MRWFAILAVLAYRLFVRPFHRRVCLFPESCSAYAIRMLRVHGLLAGTRAIRVRLRACRLPRAACFVLDTEGRATLIQAHAHHGTEVPAGAIAVLAEHAAVRVREGHD